MRPWASPILRALIVLPVLVVACRAPWQSSTPTATLASPAAAGSTPSATPTPSTPTPAASGHTATAAVTTPQPTPTATPVPGPTATVLTHSGCCGAFAWADATHLLAFDTPSGGQPGSWLFDVQGGSPPRVSPEFGPPSPAGIIPISDTHAGVTRLIKLDGTEVGRIQNGGVATWVSDDGRRVAWLQPLPGSTASSLLARPVRLWVANVDGSNARSLIDVLAAEVSWLPDNHRLLLVARALDASSPGVWLVDVDTGAHQVLVQATFVQALRLSPSGKWFTYLVTFSGDHARDGLWVGEVDGPQRLHVAGSAMVRWGPDDRTLWRLVLGPGSGDDQLVSVDVATGAEGRPNDIGGRVLNDDWEVAPDGRSVAYWRESDRNVVIATPLR